MNTEQADQSWWHMLQDIRSGTTESIYNADIAMRLVTLCSDQPFVHMWAPVASLSLQRLQRECKTSDSRVRLKKAAWLDLGSALLQRLCEITERATWEQFKQARTIGQMILADLALRNGLDDANARSAYQDFVDNQIKTGYTPLLDEFPVIGRLVETIIAFWLESCKEMLLRTCAKRLEFEEVFGIGGNETIARVQLGLSDPHFRGRIVAIYHFSSPGKRDCKKVVYKPRDIGLDRRYQEFLEFIGSNSSLGALRVLKVVEGEGYGFLEYIKHSPYVDEEETHLFYYRSGRLLAVLYLLGCTDCHYENLIASGAHLVLVDTETLLESEGSLSSNHSHKTVSSVSQLRSLIYDSVLRTGLVPQWTSLKSGELKAIDLSAIGITPPPLERKTPCWINLNTDGMMAGSIRLQCDLPSSLPVQLGARERISDFVDVLCQGFVDQLIEVMHQRYKYSSALSQFSGTKRRLVIRPTFKYLEIQREITMPESLRSEETNRALLEKLLTRPLHKEKGASLLPFLSVEAKQLTQLDIPYFEMSVDSSEIDIRNQHINPKAWFQKSGLEVAQTRVLELDEERISFQSQLLRGSIAARYLEVSKKRHSFTERADRNANSSSKVCLDYGNYQDEAYHIGQKLWESAMCTEYGEPAWVGIDLRADAQTFRYGVIGSSLFSGMTGIALVFARLSVDAKRKARTNVARMWHHRATQTFEHIRSRIVPGIDLQLSWMSEGINYGVAGYGGLLLALNLLEDAGITEAGEMANIIIGLLPDCVPPIGCAANIFSGIGGLVGPLTNRKNNAKAQNTVSAIGAYLSGLLDTRSSNLMHSTLQEGEDSQVAPFSHGLLGIAATLVSLASVSARESEITNAADMSAEYIREECRRLLLSYTRKSTLAAPKQMVRGWCCGITSILLLHAILHPLGMGWVIEEEIREAAYHEALDMLSQTMAMSQEPQSQLCGSGVLGQCAVLRLYSSSSMGIVDSRVRSAESTLILQSRSDSNYNILGVNQCGVGVPGLFTGTAGVALTFLEAASGLCSVPPLLSNGLLVGGAWS